MRWEIKNGKLSLELNFENVQKLAAFIQSIAPVIDRENHHPDMRINHTKLELQLFTYDKQCISERDYRMAELISEKFRKSIVDSE